MIKPKKMLFCVDGEIGVSDFLAMYVDSVLNIAVFSLARKPLSIDIHQIQSNFDVIIQKIWTEGRCELPGIEFVYLDARHPGVLLFSPKDLLPWRIPMDTWDKIWAGFGSIETVYPEVIGKTFPPSEDAKVLAPLFPVYYVDRDSSGEAN